jgi:hypothetical protein
MLRRFSLFFIFSMGMIHAQYTDQINSNRPGASIGAFAVGKGIIQFEGGFEYRKYKHEDYNYSSIKGDILFFSARWGFLLERLELTYQGSFMFDQLTNKISSQDLVYKRKGFLQNFLGIKYLIYDPFKKEEKVDFYSWKANNGFKLKHLIPAVSLTAGGNFLFGKNHPYPFGDIYDVLYRPIFYQNLNASTDTEPFFSMKAVLATQSHFLGTWVFVTNFIYDRYLTEQTSKSYILTLTHTFHPLCSVYLENEGLYTHRFNDQIFRAGAAYLFSDNIQIESSLGVNTNSRPSWLFMNIGVSYRLNFHKDFISAAEIEYKESKKEEKELKKTMKKNNKAERKRARKAKRI